MTITYVHTSDGTSHLVDMPMDSVIELIQKAKKDSASFIIAKGSIYKRIMIVTDSIIAVKEL